MTTAAIRTPRRLRVTLAAAALGSLLLSGCAVFSPTVTDFPAQVADGVNASYGDLDVRNLVIVSNAKDAAGNVVGQLVNTGDEDVKVDFASEGSEGTSITVPRRSSVTLGEGEAATLSKIAVSPGDLLPLQVATPQTGQNLLSVPVLPSLEYYEDSKPSGGPDAQTPDTEHSEGESH